MTPVPPASAARPPSEESAAAAAPCCCGERKLALAVKVLGRVHELDNVPLLIYALTDPDLRLKDQDRLFHLNCSEEGSQSSLPLLLKVRNPAETAASN